MTVFESATELEAASVSIRSRRLPYSQLRQYPGRDYASVGRLGRGCPLSKGEVKHAQADGKDTLCEVSSMCPRLGDATYPPSAGRGNSIIDVQPRRRLCELGRTVRSVAPGSGVLVNKLQEVVARWLVQDRRFPGRPASALIASPLGTLVLHLRAFSRVEVS
ncbi:hypothetical protein OH76DRAFT_689242 [Lentinus brumalis]|uniref:Uncharacterized protein n=1 Tax=Lentinus brumalis TaxID=2498619 RepID=A0A371D607_9APHY|nr:hypothetical protein OH76DRAFT_689242 [Polyporus brumalis]